MGERAARTLLLLLGAIRGVVAAQDLAPRAYLITPVGSNAIVYSFSYTSGAILLDPTIPVEDASSRFETNIVSAYHSFDLLGRSANITVALPYVFGDFEATVSGDREQAHRSGLGDGRVRLAANLRGGRAMSLKEYADWREKTTIGASFTISFPSGQYDPSRVINPGVNRWAFKPELGATRRWGKWMLDVYGGAWLFTANSQFYPGRSVRTQSAVLNGEAHFGRYVKPRLWASVDANFWSGGDTSIDGQGRHDRERNSRIGATVSVPLTAHQSFKFSYSAGAYVTIGGNYKAFSAGWQYSWIGGI